MTTPSPEVAVRAALASDADAIAAVHAAAWRTDYGHLLPGRTAAVEPAALAVAWTQALADPPSPHHRVMVATSASRIVGVVAFGPNADTDAVPKTDGEVFTLVVHPADQRRGHGSRLLNASTDVLCMAGFVRVRAWVPELDQVRQEFLEGAGFAADGEVRELDAAGDRSAIVREIRLATALTATTGA